MAAAATAPLENESQAKNVQYNHFVIFVHGIEGNPSNWDFAVNIFKEKFGDSIFVVRK